MKDRSDDLLDRLLPCPRRLKRSAGVHRLKDSLRLLLDATADQRLRQALGPLSAALREAGTATRVEPAGARPASAGDVRLVLDGTGPAEGYRLTIGPNGADIAAQGAPGLFYSIQTLIQLIRLHGRLLPCVTIDDAPALPQRGYYLDITRGKVPTLSSLMALVDRLAHLKVNQLQLYVEHVFDFRFDPAISAGCDPITRAEILALDRYCRDRFIELVPSLACFGHMGRVLSLPQYRDLAEVEWKAPPWEKARWIERLRGATINPRDERARRLLTRMADEFLPLFSSGRFNVCCDETYDLGRGRNAALAARRGTGALYVEHLRFLRRLAATHGKQIMFWGDMLLHHPDSIPRVPGDCTVLDWGYEPDTPFRKAKKFIDAGLDTCVCPSVRGYQAVFNRVEKARANIAGYARTGRRLGAVGLLNTDWGDMGHFNMRACSLHGLALGAAMSWNPSQDPGPPFDEAFDRYLMPSGGVEVSRLYSVAGTAPASSWPMLFMPFGEIREVPSTADARQTSRTAAALLSELSRWTPSLWLSAEEVEELRLACRALSLCAAKALLAGGAGRRIRAAHGRQFADDMREFVRDYRRNWLRSNKPSGVREIERVLQAVAREARL